MTATELEDRLLSPLARSVEGAQRLGTGMHGAVSMSIVGSAMLPGHPGVISLLSTGTAESDATFAIRTVWLWSFAAQRRYHRHEAHWHAVCAL